MRFAAVLHGCIVLTLAMFAQAQQSHDPYLLVANQKDETISIINPETGKLVDTIAENSPLGHAHELETSADGRFAFAPVYGNSGVGKPGTNGNEMLVLDLDSRKFIGKVDFGHGVRPHCVKLNPKDGLLYITTEADNAITIVDPKSLKIVGSIPTNSAQSHMIAISNDGWRIYTSNVQPGSVSVLDVKSRKPIAVIPISANSQRISVSPDDRWVFTADQTQPRLAVIDTATNKLSTWIGLPDTGYGTDSTRDGKWLLVAIPAKNQVAIVDLKSLKVARTVEVGRSPQEILVRPDGRVAYVSCADDGKVAAIDLKTWQVRLFTAGKFADGLAWAK